MEMTQVLNREELFDRMDNDEELIQDLIELFLEDYPDLLKQIEDAIAEKNAADLKMAAHTLKGSVGNFCAPNAIEAAFEMEKRGVANDFSNIEVSMLQLKEHMVKVEDALKLLSREIVA